MSMLFALPLPSLARTICSLILFPSSSMVRILKSMPIVVIKEGVQASSQNRSRRHDLPTPVHGRCQHRILALPYIDMAAHQSPRSGVALSESRSAGWAWRRWSVLVVVVVVVVAVVVVRGAVGRGIHAPA